MTTSKDDRAMAFAQFGLRHMPMLLAAQDRATHSVTYGCFDPVYWQRRATDFPDGSRQAFVWPLALACTLNVPDNPYYRKPAIRDLVEAGVRFALNASHADGSCDQRFPQERSGSASARSLLACVEACELIGLDQLDITDFLYRRADWLSRQLPREKSGSEYALHALALLRCDQFTRSGRWLETVDTLLSQLLGWQSAEGWYPENNGLDPAQHSYSLWLLAQIRAARKDKRLDKSLELGIKLATDLIQPDGSIGGVYGSIGGSRVFPHGFELLADLHPAAAFLNAQMARTLDGMDFAACAGDSDSGPVLAAMLLTWRDWRTERSDELPETGSTRKWLPEAGLLIEQKGRAKLFAGLRRGGSFHLYIDDQLAHADSQFFVQMHGGGRARTALGNTQASNRVKLEDGEAKVSGQLAWVPRRPVSMARSILLRLGMMTLARFFPGTARNVAQRLLAQRSRNAPVYFKRSFHWLESGRLQVDDELTAEDWSQVVSIGSQAIALPANAGLTGAAPLAAPLDLTSHAARLGPGESLQVQREF